MKSKFTFSKWAERLYGKKIHSPIASEKAWSVKHEGHLNINNIIFETDKYKKIVDELIEYDKSLGKRDNND